jgi:GNAT superfamily N-acetyltransferase
MRATLSIAHEMPEIRQAVMADVPSIMKMGRHFYDASPYPEFAEYDEDAVGGVFARMIASDQAAIIVASYGDDDPFGCIGLMLSPLFFAPGMTVCNELFWWVEPEQRGCGMYLVEAGEEWARGKGADVLAMSAIVEMEGDRIARMYERRGMVRAETTFMKGIN